MGKFILSCCSTADLTKDYFKNRDIQYVCFHYELNGKEFKALCGNPEFEQLYERIKALIVTKQKDL